MLASCLDNASFAFSSYFTINCEAIIRINSKDKWVAIFGGGFNNGVNPNYGNAVYVIDLENNGIYQWTDNYPTISIIENDLRKNVLYTLKSNQKIIGAINISEEQEAKYESIKWEFNNSKVLVIHRLVIDPKYQKKGYAQN